MKSKKQYTPEERRIVVDRIASGVATVKAEAERIGASEQAVRGWLRSAGKKAPAVAGPPAQQEGERPTAAPPPPPATDKVKEFTDAARPKSEEEKKGAEEKKDLPPVPPSPEEEAQYVFAKLDAMYVAVAASANMVLDLDVNPMEFALSKDERGVMRPGAPSVAPVLRWLEAKSKYANILTFCAALIASGVGRGKALLECYKAKKKAEAEKAEREKKAAEEAARARGLAAPSA